MGAEEVSKERKEHALAVGPLPVKKEQALLVRQPGQGVADGESRERHEFRVVLEDLGQELFPAGAGGFWVEGDRCEQSDLILWSARTQLAGS